MAQGKLVPDALVVAMVRERIQQVQGFLLDGFPRTVEQARALTDLLKAEGRHLTAAVLLEAPDDIVVERIACRGQGRDDDRPATVRRRLQVFHRSTAPIVDYYEQLGSLHRIDASRPVHDVTADARCLLSALGSNLTV
jgi:adenylate kinase